MSLSIKLTKTIHFLEQFIIYNACMYLCMYTYIIRLCMIKARIRWCSCRVENIITLGKLLRLWFCFLLHSILFFYISNLLSYIQNNFKLRARSPHNGNHFSSIYIIYIFILYFIGERAKRARHSQVCSIENRGYIYYVLRANFVLITRKVGGA